MGSDCGAFCRNPVHPGQVLTQDFTGVLCIVDLAVMREEMGAGGDPARISPLRPAELVIDHPVIADYFGRPGALERNIELEYRRNRERPRPRRAGGPSRKHMALVVAAGDLRPVRDCV